MNNQQDVRPSPCVLVIDDDPAIWSLVGAALEDEGYAVMAASDGAEAFVLLGEMLPAVILLDMRMPGMNGWEFARTVRERWGHKVPIIMMTASIHVDAWAKEIEADGVLPKPFDLTALSDIVAQFTGRAVSL